MTEKGQSITYKVVVTAMGFIIAGLLSMLWFFFTGFYQTTLEIQKSLQEIKLSMVKIQAEMMDEAKVRQIVRYELNSRERN